MRGRRISWSVPVRTATGLAGRALVLSAGAAALVAIATPGPTRSQQVGEADAPRIVSRAEWQAKPAVTELMVAHKPRQIIIHHTSIKTNPQRTLEQKLRGLQGFSQAPGKVGTRVKPAWGDVPYHYYIAVSGDIGEGREVAWAGDSNTSYDTRGYIQIVLEGHFDEEQPADKQLDALFKLTAWLVRKHGISEGQITGHNDHAASDCPGVNLKAYLPKLTQHAMGK